MSDPRTPAPAPGLSALLAAAAARSSTSQLHHLPSTSSSSGPTSSAAISSAYAQHGTNLRAANAAQLKTQLEVFQQLLWEFSTRHGREIRRDPRFRAEFARMCAALGVDPFLGLSGEGKGSGGSGLLRGGSTDESGSNGRSQDFYHSLAVRVVQVCRTTRAENGGLISLAEVRGRILRATRSVLNSSVAQISTNDVRRAVQSLEPLGSGFSVISFAGVDMIRSVPRELNTDQGAVLSVVTVLGGWVTVSVLRDNLSWEEARVHEVMGDLMADGLVWLDAQAEGEWVYWSPTAIREGEV